MVNFSPVLEWKIIPLCEILNDLLALGEKALGCPVEIEFAVNIFKDNDKASEFYLLQIKPMVLTTTKTCLLYTSPSPRDQRGSRMPSSA